MLRINKKKYLDKYRVLRSADWIYENPSGSYKTEFAIIEDKIIFEIVKGRPSLQDAKEALKIITNIIEENFLDNKPHYISDTREVSGADASVRKFVSEFHRNNPIFASVSLITSTFTKALFSIVKNLGVSDLKNWKVYRDEKYCIDEILKGEVIIGSSHHNNHEHELIYKALADISNNRFSYDELLKKTKSNDELRSVIQALQILDEENRSESQDSIQRFSQTEDQFSTILFKSILENTETVVSLLNIDYSIVNANDNFLSFFDSKDVKGKEISEFLKIDQKLFDELEATDYVQFNSSFSGKTVACKLYKVKMTDVQDYIIFMAEDVSEKETLKATEKKLLKELQEQNFKLLKVNHLLSHEINHQIASLSQILSEFRSSLYRDPNVENMISKVQNELNVSLNRINNTLFNSEYSDINISEEEGKIDPSEKLSFLLIDDDEITNLLNEKVVKNNLENCELVVETNAHLALESISKGNYSPDVILLDLYMPVMDGFEFLEALEKKNLTKKPIIFVLSSSRDPEEIAQANSYDSVCSYYTKPLSKDKVMSMLNSIYDQ